ncbi:MAG TPA: hypothetical protein VHM20_03665 [Gammaproteobacteria bacterium]|jgi:hypothetical protein|nr:hypothetical protein [Gammaproteobacteria bacterium]
MFDRSKIKKILFISENRKGIVLNDAVLICDEKDNILREWKGKNGDLIKIKNHPIVAYVHHVDSPLRRPFMRRNAIIEENLFANGHTHLMHIDQWEKPICAIPYAFSHLMLLNQKYIGISGLRVVIQHAHALYHPPRAIGFAQNYVPINDNYFIMQTHDGAQVKFEKRGRILDDFVIHSQLSKVCVLRNDRFLAQDVNKVIMIFDLNATQKMKVIHSRPNIPSFEEIIMLPDSDIVLARDQVQNLYLMDTQTLQIQKIFCHINQGIRELALSEKNRIIAVLEDGSYLNIGEKILAHSPMQVLLHQETSLATVLIDKIVKFAGDYHHFFQIAKKPMENHYLARKNML